MQWALAERESGLLSLQGATAFGHRPAAFAAAALGDAGLARRLSQVAVLPGHSGAVSALAWTEAGELLASGGEDCRLRLWRGATSELLHSLDTGHTATILSAAFLPGSRGDQLLCCSADRQIRHIAVTKGAVRPYLVHSGRVRSVTPLDAHVFLSASEDGTVREFDVRQRPVAVHRDALAGDDSNVLVDQRAERVGRSRVRVGIYSLAVDPLRPWMMLTGGSDPLLRLYDRRMLPDGDGKAPQWVSAYVPSHIKSSVLDSGRHPALAGDEAGALPGHAVTAVAFARGGAELVGSYSGECIYSFDTLQHARDVEALLHISESVLRAPARPRSHIGRRSMRGLRASGSFEAAGQSPAGQAGLAAAAAAAVAAAVVAAAVLEGAGGTTPAVPEAGRLREQLQAQQAQRARAARGIAIASSVRRLERQRRQQSRVAAAAEEPPRAESSRPAHWQMRPTSSTLRSPLHALHTAQHAQHGHHHNLRHHAQQQAQQPSPHRQRGPQAQQQQQQQQPQQDARQPPNELPTDSEGPSDGPSPEGPSQRQAVRRSRRIMRRRRDAAEAAEQQQHPEGTAAGAGPGQNVMQQQAQQPGLLAVQQPAVSGVAEPAVPPSSSDGEDRGLHSPATRGRRVRRRTLPPQPAADAAAVQPQQLSGAGVVPDVAEAAAVGSGDGGFKAPPGRSPQHPRRQAATAAVAMQRLDSTLGLLHHHAPQLEASEVAAAPQHAQQEATVSMRAVGGPPAGGGQRGSAAADRLAAEVTSRPVPSASRVGLGTQLGSQQAGHEASSLNSAEQPANERVGSVVQRPQLDAPSVGNAPVGTAGGAAAAAAAAGAPGEQQEVQQQEVQQTQQTVEVQEASTGHRRGARLLPPPPHFAAHPGAGPHHRQQLQPTASTGTSRPPAFASQAQHGQRYLPPAASGRQASRLRRHSDNLDASQPAEAAAAAAYAAGSQAVADGSQPATADAAEQKGVGRAPSAAAQLALSLQQAQPQATMLSGRGPSVLGEFMPGQHEQLADSEIAQQWRQQGSMGAQRGEADGGTQPQAGGQQAAGLRQGRRRQVDSNIGAIVVGTDGDGEEVSEPTMFSRRYAGHLNLSAAAPNDGPPLAPQLAFLGLHSELLVSPSDCGSLFIWDYGTARVAAVLPPHAPSASSSGSGGGELTPSAAATCVATHPLLPVLAGGGADSVVRLWSPEAEEACSRELAAAAVGANLQALAELGGLGSESGGATDRLADDPSALFLPGSPCAFQ